MPFLSILKEPLAFWASNCNGENIPDIVHCNGLLPSDGLDTLTFYIAEAFSETFIANLSINPQITFMGCSIYTFESYQYKGVFQTIKACRADDIRHQERYLDAVTDVLSSVGYSKEIFYKAYFHQPSYAVTFRVSDIFEQTPRKGTGTRMLKE